MSDREMLERLDRLQAESRERSAELRSIADQLPVTMSRRALLRALVVDVRHSPNKRAIVGRAVSKIARAPLHLAKRIQLRLTARS